MNYLISCNTRIRFFFLPLLAQIFKKKMDLSQNLMSPVWVESLVCNVWYFITWIKSCSVLDSRGALKQNQSLSTMVPAESFWFQQIMFDSELLLPLFDFDGKGFELENWLFELFGFTENSMLFLYSYFYSKDYWWWWNHSHETHTRTHNLVSLHAAVWIYCMFQTHLELREPTFYVHFLFWCQLYLIVLQRQLLNSYQQRAKVCTCVWASAAHFDFLWKQCFLADMNFGMCSVRWSKIEVNLCTQCVCIYSSAWTKSVFNHVNSHLWSDYQHHIVLLICMSHFFLPALYLCVLVCIFSWWGGSGFSQEDFQDVYY